MNRKNAVTYHFLNGRYIDRGKGPISQPSRVVKIEWTPGPRDITDGKDLPIGFTYDTLELLCEMAGVSPEGTPMDDFAEQVWNMSEEELDRLILMSKLGG